MKTFKLILVGLLIYNFSYSQNTEALEQINQQIWAPFTKAFETSDYKLFESIHNSDLIRVSGDQGKISTFKNYIKSYKKRWESSAQKQTISFRFLERIVGDNIASERGIYKFTINPKTAEEQSYYGKFHVLHKKINGIWKIILDYDSNEKNTINEKSYLEATPLEKY